MITERQINLLRKIIQLYVKDADPVASGLLAGKMSEKVSSATVRNEMVELEADGYIAQPHTSAGRIPTEKAFSLVVDNFLERTEALPKKIQTAIDTILKTNNENRRKIKEIAKQLAEETGLAVVAAFSVDDNFYTGLSNLFSQPEFSEKAQVINISQIIDRLDLITREILREQNFNEVKVLIGKENPFGSSCGAVVGFYKFAEFAGLIAILGPMRMDYQKCFTLLNGTINLLK
jgi:transcriptional regulator of heat shock response